MPRSVISFWDPINDADVAVCTNRPSQIYNRRGSMGESQASSSSPRLSSLRFISPRLSFTHSHSPTRLYFTNSPQ